MRYKNILLIIFQCIFSGLPGIINHHITLVDTFLPLSSARPNFSIQIHLGQQCMSGPLIETSIIITPRCFGQQIHILRYFFHNEVKDLFTGRLLWQGSIFKVCHNGHITIQINQNIIIGSTKNFQFGNQLFFRFAIYTDNAFFYLRQNTVTSVHAIVCTFPSLKHTVIFGSPSMLMPPFIDIAIYPSNTITGGKNILIRT